jgi:uncharacterized protein YecT (DUF1311 family)
MTIALSFAACGTVRSEDQPDCTNAVTQQDMNQCAALDFEAADAELNIVWKDARASARAVDADLPDDLRGADKALLDAQRAWIAYRDGHCALAGFEARGGSLEPLLVSACLATLTRTRTQQLKEFISDRAQ